MPAYISVLPQHPLIMYARLCRGFLYHDGSACPWARNLRISASVLIQTVTVKPAGGKSASMPPFGPGGHRHGAAAVCSDLCTFYVNICRARALRYDSQPRFSSVGLRYKNTIVGTSPPSHSALFPPISSTSPPSLPRSHNPTPHTLMSQQFRSVPRGPSRRPGQPSGRGGRGSSPSTRGRGSSGPSGEGSDFSATSSGGRPRGTGGRVRSGPPAAVFGQGQPLKQDERLADSELKQLVESFSCLKVKPEMPLRPGWGTLGQAGSLRTNFFSVKLPKDATFYEYEVSINPKAQAKGDRRHRIMQLVEQSPEFSPYVAHIAHDRSQRLVSTRKLPQPLDIPIKYLEEDQTNSPNPSRFTVEIKFREELNMSDLDRCVRTSLNLMRSYL